VRSHLQSTINRHNIIIIKKHKLLRSINKASHAMRVRGRARLRVKRRAGATISPRNVGLAVAPKPMRRRRICPAPRVKESAVAPDSTA
jgi:hypothetical protein